MQPKKYCVIIDSYPQTLDDKRILLENLKILKCDGIDVLLTSHSTCTPEIIENSTYFLFEKKNDYYFLDSNILDGNIRKIKNPIFLNYVYLGNSVFRDRLVITGWSVSIVSQIINSIKFLYGKGYDYAFYLISDCICPKDIKFKLEEILEDSKENRNYFIKNVPNFSSWYAPFFFGFTLDQNLVSKLINKDFSQIEIYQEYFPNCSFEDFVLRIWEGDNNFVAENLKLDEIFGEGKWNLTSSVLQKGTASFHANTSSSIYANPETGELCLMLMVTNECPSQEVYFEIQIFDLNENILFKKEITLAKMQWFQCDVTNLVKNNSPVILKKYVKANNDFSLLFEDYITIDLNDFEFYSLVKNFEKVK